MDQRLRTYIQEMDRRWTRDCGHNTGDGPETADTVQGMTRDCGQVQEMTRDCRQYRR
ncbi:unnamed protein product [Staurois parvus]|uniref:Uncharacterized protein n=1 Tax=Staurois parvus TaxID=386267 RepID=A0ABN9F0P6_9NEOB|nr:unnamed protein product [Staurois parvus]